MSSFSSYTTYDGGMDAVFQSSSHPSSHKSAAKPRHMNVTRPSENPSTPEFAFQLLQAQLRLDSNEDVNQELIMKLFQLYRLAIEYYNQKRNPRQIFFKKKLQSFTNNPNVLGALHECDTKSDTFYKKKQIERQLEIEQKKSINSKQLLKSVYESELKVESQLKIQSDKIQKRLNQRRSIKNGAFGSSVIEPSQHSVQLRKKLSKTMIINSVENENEDMAKYFVNEAVVVDYK